MHSENNLVTRHYLNETSGDFAAFEASVNRTTQLSDYPLASDVEQGAPVYDADTCLLYTSDAADE